MTNFATIQNAELAKLMQASVKFHALPAEKQEAHLERISKLPIDAQVKLAEFFREENAKENRARVERLKKAYEELCELEVAFKKEIAKDKELKVTQDEEAKVNSMLNNL